MYQIRSYPAAFGGSSAQAGWEYVEGLRLEAEAPRVAEQAAALLKADPCPVRVATVVIDSEQMALQVHESVGHPTELDRVYGTEAAYAGTSFLKPGDIGQLRYGSKLMNVTADATTDDGVYLEQNRSWSIDDKRLNFQFGTQIAWEIKKGELGRMLRDATYTGVTPVFWGSLDALGGPETWHLYGLTNCGKGQPGQLAHVSHGAPAARFRNVQVDFGG
jgi:predicted Zn-dependent protease